jgi:hypothetical protein
MLRPRNNVKLSNSTLRHGLFYIEKSAHKKRRRNMMEHPPQARKYSTTGPNTGPGLPHPTELAPTRHAQFIVIAKKDNTRYMLGSLPSAHTPTDFL